MLTDERRTTIKSTVARNLKRKDTFQYELVLEGVLIGFLVGVLIACFRLCLSEADSLRSQMVNYANEGIVPGLICLAVVAVTVVLVSALLKFEPQISGSGIPQIEGELKGSVSQNWWRVIVGKFAGCVLSIGGGLSLGREGPSVQLGAMVGKGFARKTGKLLTEERMLMTCGAGAGLSAAFGAPLAGAIFSLEELHKNFSAEVLISTMAATAVADYTAVNIVGLTPVFNFDVAERLPLKYYWAIVVFGIVLGAFGAFYNKFISWLQDGFDFLKHDWLKIGLMMAIAFALFFVYPIALGSGNELVAEISNGKFALGALLCLLVVKFLFSTSSFGSGAPGGIFLPLLVLGAIAGGLFCRVLGMAIGLDQQYITSFVIIGMAGYFAAIVRAPVTGIILITEMTGDFSSLLALTVTSLTAYLIADICGGIPIYEQLLERSLKHSRAKRITGQEEMPKEEYIIDRQADGDGKEVNTRERKVIIDSEVYYGSVMDGKRVREIGLPAGSLIVAVTRSGKELIPDGETVLYGGDELEVLCRNKDIRRTEKTLDKKCKKIKKESEGIGD